MRLRLVEILSHQLRMPDDHWDRKGDFYFVMEKITEVWKSVF